MAKRKDDGSAAKKSGALNNPIRNLVIATVVSVILGVAFLVWPDFVYDYCGYAVGGLICLIGVVYVLLYFLRKPVSGVYRSEFALGLIALAAGGYVIFASFMPHASGVSITLRLIVCALGVLVAVDGILKLQYTLDLARMKFRAWWVGFITSLLGIALGVLTVMGIIDGMAVRFGVLDGGFFGAMLLLGVGFCVNAALDLITVILVAVRNRKAAKAEAAPAPVPEPVPEAPVYAPPVYAPAAAPAAPAEPAAPSAPEAPAPAADSAPAPAEPPAPGGEN